jgi:hypothetical protein
MAFDNDVFISYTHIDNKPLGESQKGWIAMLAEALDTRLSQLLGENPRIWRDRKLDGNDRFDQEIIDQLMHAAVLVSVLSPRYLNSEWCQRELNTFYEGARESGGLYIDNKSRIFKVQKTPTEREPEETRNLLGYPFYKEDPETGRCREFNRAFGQDLELEFWRALDDLAQDIKQLLEMLRTGRSIEPTGATVYLAETTSDLREERDQLRRELEAHGHRVLPDRRLPVAGDELEAAIAHDLEVSELSIHPIGAVYGLVPEARQQSLLEIQNALATRFSKVGKLSRLVWIPPDLQLSDGKQKAFIDALNDDPELSSNDSVLETTLEELKTVIRDKLQPKPAQPAGTNGLRRLYLVFDEADEDAVQDLDDWLYDRGFEVKRPLLGGDEVTIRADHLDKLRIADGVLIYWGAGDEGWLSRMLLDLAETPAAGRTSTIYLGAPETRHKARYRTREVDEVIKAFGGFEPELLSGFLGRLESDQGGGSG